MFADRALGPFGQKYIYSRVPITNNEDIFGIVCSQSWLNSKLVTFFFQLNGKGYYVKRESGKGSLSEKGSVSTEFNWIINPEKKLILNFPYDTPVEYDLVWRQGGMALETENRSMILTPGHS